MGIRAGCPLHAAAFHGSVAVLSLLCAQRADANARGHRGTSALFEACRRGQLDAARYLLEAGAMVDAAIDGGGTPLCAAAEAGWPHVCDLLLQHGAAPTAAVTQAMRQSAKALEAQRAAEVAAAAAPPLALSRQWVRRVRRMPPLTWRLLVANEAPGGISAASLLLEQSNGPLDSTATLGPSP